ncbi:MAG: thiamine diphosphokinase [Oscillospiraceae bacterium]|nr:thiamine diphosphokinase [Oscillospiraceae bacterium]
MSERCYIVGAGEYSGGFVPECRDFVIAADAGYTRILRCGIVPDLVVGDFDSLGAPPEHPNIMQSPAEKDDTDLMLAVRQGLLHGCKTFIIDGALGGRPDQTLANYQILVHLARNGALGVLLGQDMCVTAVTNGSVCFSPPSAKAGMAMGADSVIAPKPAANADRGDKELVSIFSVSDRAEGVSLAGLKYPLSDAVLTCDFPLGVSNEFTEAAAAVSVRNGTLLIMWTGGLGRLKAAHGV